MRKRPSRSSLYIAESRQHKPQTSESKVRSEREVGHRMVAKGLRLAVGGGEMAGDYDEPVSPTGQYFNSSALSVGILAVFEFDVPIDDSPTMFTLKNQFLPITPRFSSIMVRDENGVQQWKRVEVKLEDHVHIPVFPPGLDQYDDYVRDYMSKIAMDRLPLSRPLWALHLIKYPTRSSEGTLVFKLHHALGDGFTLMGALFSCIQRADDPSLPLTFPTSRVKPVVEEIGWRGIIRRVPRAVSVCVNTVKDFGWSLLKSSIMEDDRSPIRSGDDGVEFRPIIISTVSFSLQDVARIKDKLGGTVNDVVTGIIFYGIQLYMYAVGQGPKSLAEVTSLVLLNTRVIDNYQHLKEMIKPDAKSPWGNQFGFLHISVPGCKDVETEDPLRFVFKARQSIKAKRSSLAVYLTGRLLQFITKIKGPETTAKYIHQTLKNTSLTISNLTGPMEQIVIAGHRIRSLYFMVVGVPQSLTVTIFSYHGKIEVAIGAEKGYIDSELIISCMKRSFERISEAADCKMAK